MTSVSSTPVMRGAAKQLLQENLPMELSAAIACFYLERAA